MLCGCVAPKGLQRTPWLGWERKSFDRLGVELELPEQPLNIYKKYDMVISDNETYIKNTGMKSISFGFHPSWSGSNFAEPNRMLTISIDKIPRDVFVKNGRQFSPEVKMEEHEYPFGNTPRAFIGIDRQIQTPNGDIIVIHGSFQKTPDSETGMDEDISAMRRIVESVRMLSSGLNQAGQPQNKDKK